MKKSGANKPTSGPLKEVFRNKLESIKSEPSEQLWNRLELHLDKQEVSRDRKRLVFFLNIAASVLLLLVSAGGWLAYQHFSPAEKQIAATAKNEGAGKINQEIPSAATDQSSIASGAAGIENPDTEPSGTLQNSNSNARLLAQAVNKKEAVNKNPQAVNRNQNTGNYPSNSEKEIVKSDKIALRSQANNVPAKPNKAITTRSETKQLADLPANQGPVRAAQDLPSGATQSGASSLGNPFAEGISGAGTDLAQKRENDKNLAGSRVGITDNQEATETSEIAKVSKPQTTVTDSAEVIVLRPELLPLPESEEEKEIAKAPGRWSMGLAMSSSRFDENVTLAYKKPGDITNHGNSGLEEAVEQTNNSKTPGTSYQTGLLVNRQLTNLFSVKSGITYALFSTTSTSSYLVRPAGAIGAGVQNNSYMDVQETLLNQDPANSYYQVDQITPFTITTSYQYVNLPVAFQVEVPVQKWRFSVSPGVQAGKLLKTDITSDQEKLDARKYNSGDNSPYRSWLISGVLSAGVGYQLSGNWQIKGSADFQRGFSGISAPDNQALKSEAPTVFSGSIGLWYTFKNRK